MNPALLKGLIGLGVVGGAGLSVGGYYWLKSSEPKNLLKKFRSQNLKVLDYWTESISESGTEDYAEWTSKVTKYKTSTDEVNKNKFSGLDMSGSDDTQNQQKLREECKKYLEKPLKEISATEGLEEKVRFWCTKQAS